MKRPAGAPCGKLQHTITVKVSIPRWHAPTDEATARRELVNSVRYAIKVYQKYVGGHFDTLIKHTKVTVK